MRSKNPVCPNFLDKKDSNFKQLHNSLDLLFNRLHSEGIGRQIKKAEIISIEDEKKLWESGILNTTTPKGLHFIQLAKYFAFVEVRNIDF